MNVEETEQRRGRRRAPPAAAVDVDLNNTRSMQERREHLVEQLQRRREEALAAEALVGEAIITGADTQHGEQVLGGTREAVARLESAIALLDSKIVRAGQFADREAQRARDLGEIRAAELAVSALEVAIPEAIDVLVAALVGFTDDRANVEWHARRRAIADVVIEHVGREFDSRLSGRSWRFRAELAELAAPIRSRVLRLQTHIQTTGET